MEILLKIEIPDGNDCFSCTFVQHGNIDSNDYCRLYNEELRTGEFNLGHWSILPCKRCMNLRLVNK